MIFLKSILAGFAGVIAVAFLGVLGMMLYLSTKFHNLPEGTSVGWDPVSLMHQSVIAWVIIAAAFIGGFAWEWKRAKAKCT